MDSSLSQFILFSVTGTSAVIAALWLGMILWTWRDMHTRSRDKLARVAAAAVVAVLNIFGLILYLMLRPRETLTEAYERSLEEESLLQGIEEKPICPGCGRPSDLRWQVCPYCHTRLKKPCVNCAEMLDLPWTLCPYCTAPQPMYEMDAAPQPPAPTQSRGNAARNRTDSAPPPPLEFVDD